MNHERYILLSKTLKKIIETLFNIQYDMIMKKRPKIYLDNCAYNRPFDDKEQLAVKMEAEAKLHIQDEIRAGKYDLVWSYMNEYENMER